jgi:hypothetical protein
MDSGDKLMDVGIATVAKKPRPKGRPKKTEDEKTDLRTSITFKGSDEFIVWLDKLVDFQMAGTRANLIRSALRVLADKQGFAEPMPRS